MTRISRRTLLRSATLAGVALALPPLEVMVSNKSAQAATPKRLFLFHYPHGLFLPDWYPSGAGADWSPSLLMQKQPDDPAGIDADLASIREDINIVSGLSNPTVDTDAHTGPNNGFLTCALDSEKNPTNASLDEIVAGAIGKDTLFPALRLSVYQNLSYDDMSTTVCFDASGKPIAMQASPKSLYASLVGLVAPGENAPASTFPQDFRRSVLDYVKTDIERVQKLCGVGDRRVLEEHFDSVRELEKRIDILQTVSCELPNLDSELAQLPDPAGAGYVPHWPDNAGAENLPLRSDVLLRLAVLAMRCDLTRVVVFSTGPSSCRMTFPFLGMGNTDDHYYSHLQKAPLDRATQLEWNRVSRWKLAQFSRAVQQLKAPGGTGSSLLDETVVIGASELANGAGHTTDLMPVVVAGNLGAMATASSRNRHVAVPCNPNASIFNPPGTGQQTPISSVSPGVCAAGSGFTPLANLWLTAMRALGLQDQSFANSTGVIDGLWL